VYRIDPPETVLWYDVDYPETIDLRSRIYPDRRGYRMIGSSVTDLDWLAELPTGRPAFVVAEGLTMYLDPMGGPALLSALVHTLPTGQMAFDAFSRLGIRLSKLNTVVRRADATLHWGIDDAAELRPLGLELIEVLQAPDFVPPEYADRLSRSLKVQLWITEHLSRPSAGWARSSTSPSAPPQPYPA
jgi:O-methyltransferase involved in polyketide biosynthesis